MLNTTVSPNSAASQGDIVLLYIHIVCIIETSLTVVMLCLTVGVCCQHPGVLPQSFWHLTPAMTNDKN